jgi:hypothetical protein
MPMHVCRPDANLLNAHFHRYISAGTILNIFCNAVINTHLLGFENMRANVGVRISNGALHDRVHTRWQVED